MMARYGVERKETDIKEEGMGKVATQEMGEMRAKIER